MLRSDSEALKVCVVDTLSISESDASRSVSAMRTRTRAVRTLIVRLQSSSAWFATRAQVVADRRLARHRTYVSRTQRWQTLASATTPSEPAPEKPRPTATTKPQPLSLPTHLI